MFVWPAGQPYYIAKTFTLDITYKIFNHFFPIQTMLTGTIAFYHFISVSLTLTFRKGHKVSTK